MQIVENSSVVFDSNRGREGGAIHLSYQISFAIDNDSMVTFTNNTALLGGSLFVTNTAIAIFKGNFVVQFNINTANYGGSIVLKHSSMIRFKEQSKVTIEDNTATVIGGAIYGLWTSDVYFTQYTTVIFYNNTAEFGESIYTNYSSSVTIKANTTVTFNNNTARWYGSVPYSNKYGYSDIAFDSNGTVSCSDIINLPACINQVCFCKDIYYVLASLTNDTHIDLSINVTLSSIIPLVHFNNISITGHNNPIIDCNGNGGVLFTYCHNCTIEGITWNGCGGKDINGSSVSGIGFYNSTNIIIQNCTFLHSVGQAVILSDVSESVKISHCRFLCNKHYEGHGSAVYSIASSYFQYHTQLLFIISNCNFSKNERSNSIVYIGQYNNKLQFFFLNNSIFSDNQGTSIYLSNQNLYVVGNVLFINNTVGYGAAIYANDHSTITFVANSVIAFTDNTANNSGGALSLNHYSSVIFEGNCVVTFSNNIATQQYGGSIYSYNNSKGVIKQNCSVQFIENMAKFGGALYFEANSNLTVEESSSVIFKSNEADLGGAIYLIVNSVVSFKEHNFEVNMINLHKATMLFYSTYIFRNKSMIPVFIGNIAAKGGAIHASNNSIIHFTV